MKTLINDIALKIRSTPLVWLNDEKRLQYEIEKVLKTITKVETLAREYKLDAHNTIDFLINDAIGIELKIKGQKVSIYNQCQRYTQFDKIQVLILMTNVSIGFPTQLNNKDCYVIKLSTGWL